MPELPELTVVQEVRTCRSVGQTMTAADVILPGAAMVVRDLTGAGFGAAAYSGVIMVVATVAV